MSFGAPGSNNWGWGDFNPGAGLLPYITGWQSNGTWGSGTGGSGSIPNIGGVGAILANILNGIGGGGNSGGGSNSKNDSSEKGTDWWKIAALLAGLGGGAYGLSQLGGGSGDAINPMKAPATWPEAQNKFGEWLFGNIGKGVDPYPGQLNVDPASTILPKVWENWQPWNTGNSYMAKWLDNADKNGFGEDPRYKQLRQWGGTGGPGHQAMSSMMQYGAPAGPIGQLMSSYAQGYPQYGGAHLAQFLQKPVRR